MATLDRDAYAKWWDDNTDDDGEPRALDEPAATLAAHVVALQERIDKLAAPDDHDKAHGRECRCYATQCCCAYDHPGAVCMVHREVTA